MTHDIAAKTSFSIITICKNNYAGLLKTWQSLKAQDDKNLEWIVIDGGSSDETIEFLKTTKALWLSESDNGIYDAMNKGIDMAGGDYIWFMNAGDLFGSHKVFECIRHEMQYCEYQPDFIYGDFLSNDRFGEPTYREARSFNKTAPMHMFTSHQAMLYNRNTMGTLRFDTNYKIASDYKFTIQHLKLGGRVLYCDIPLCIFEHGGVSQQQPQSGRFEQYSIRKECGVANPITNMGMYIGQSIHHRIQKCA